MEFHIAIGAARPDLVHIDESLRQADPAALVDIDNKTLRVATSLGASELQGLLAAAGYPIASSQLTQLPSICCGGCSG